MAQKCTDFGILFIIVLTYLHCALSYTENCDYLDKSRKDRTNYLTCNNFGCCGDFKHRHCCLGPIAIVAGVFGGLLLILIVVIIVGICYTNYKKKNAIKPASAVTPGMYNGIPEPSPPISTPSVYNSARLRPPPVITQSKLLLKTPVPPNATDLTSINATSSTSTAFNGQGIPFAQRDTLQQINEIQENMDDPPLQKSESTGTIKFKDVRRVVRERVFHEFHPPPSELHPPSIAAVRK